MTDMTIYEKHSDNVRYFETPQEFLKFYEDPENKEKMDKMSTRAINTSFKIRGKRVERQCVDKEKNIHKIKIMPLRNKSVFYLEDNKKEIDVDDKDLKIEFLERRLKNIEEFLIKQYPAPK